MSPKSLLLLVPCLACAGVEPVPDVATAEASAESGFVLIRVVPKATHAILRVDQRVLALPPEDALRLSLAPGTYVIDASAPGFQVARSAVLIETGREVEVTLELQADGNAAARTSVPAANAGAEEPEEPSVPERVARGAAGEVGKRTKSRAVREYRSLIDRALDYLIGRGRS